MKHQVRNAVIAIAVLVIAALSIVPPSTKLRLGKDLAGGVSLVYLVQFAPGDDPGSVMDDLKASILDRVDPSGQLDITIVAKGRDRIEITMPLPDDGVKALRAEYLRVLDEATRAAVSAGDVDLLIRLPEADRRAGIDRMAGSDTDRRANLESLAAASDAALAARSAYDAAVARGAAPEELDPLIAAAGQAVVEYEAKRDELLRSAVSAEALRRALEKPKADTIKYDQNTEQPLVLPSPRRLALDRLIADHPGSEPSIRRVQGAFEEYESQRRSLDDPGDLTRLVGSAGVFEFRIAIRPGQHPEESRLRDELLRLGPQNVRADDCGWYKINKIENWFDSQTDSDSLEADAASFFAARHGLVGGAHDGDYYLLLWDTRGSRLTRAEGNWRVSRAYQGRDELGRPAINFVMDARGAILLGALTEAHIRDSMAVLMDDEVYTAPTLQGAISSSGQIEGDFGRAEIAYLLKVLNAGSLQAKLSPEPISTSVLAPEFGLDNLRRAVTAGWVAFGVIVLFLVGYYFNYGLVAVVGLAVNVLLLLAAMALNRSAFTLPGIAGVILTFGMAVDANVLVYERVREERERGADQKTAIRLGYSRALSAIVDGNLTNLIVCIVLIAVGTPEIRGFGLTMTIGVVTTLYSQLFVTRLIFSVLVDRLGLGMGSMLPMVSPLVARLFRLNVDWMSLRGVFWAVFAVFLALTAVMIGVRGGRMLDTEFKGGTAVSFGLRDGPDGAPITRTRSEIAEAISAYVDGAGDPSLSPLKAADVVVVDPRPDGISSDRFQVKTVVSDADEIRRAVISALSDVLPDALPALRYAGAGADPSAAPVYPVLDRVLGANISRPDVLDAADAYLGGAVILLDGLSPPPTLESLAARLDAARQEPDFSDTIGRSRTVVVLSGTPDAVTSAAVVVADAESSFFGGEDRWRAQVRDREWAIVSRALDEARSAVAVQSFSPAIAKTFKAQAAIAMALSAVLITIYVGVRFNSLRYSAAAIVPTLLDCVMVVGLIALAEMLCEQFPSLTRAVGLRPFKIDLTVVAAVLTVLGYSINDKIVVLDRIRENRGKLTTVSRDLINRSVNQTFSRTIMTGSTTIVATLILYAMGSDDVRAFSYSLMLGVIIGTASSIALGAPMVWSRARDRSAA